MKVLLVIDVQNDFIDGALANEDAQAAMPKIREKIAQRRAEGYKIVFTRDTHENNYLSTMEGKYLPYPHCIKFTHGWHIASGLRADNELTINKDHFGCSTIVTEILGDLTIPQIQEGIDEIELIGFCTDICVVSNALILKANLDNSIVKCDASCCAGTSVQAHKAALAVMHSCQVEVENDY